jgi:hypothetical protein
LERELLEYQINCKIASYIDVHMAAVGENLSVMGSEMDPFAVHSFTMPYCIDLIIGSHQINRNISNKFIRNLIYTFDI